MKSKEKEEMIVLGRCFSCKHAYLFKLMKPIILLEPQEDGMVRVKRYLCPDCSDRLKEVKFVMESDLERKEQKKLKGGRIE